MSAATPKVFPTTPNRLARRNSTLTAEVMQKNDFFHELALLLKRWDDRQVDKDVLEQKTWMKRSEDMGEELEFWKTKFLDAFAYILDFFKNKKDLEENVECEDEDGRKLKVYSDLAEDMGKDDIRYSLKYVNGNEMDVEFGVYVYHENDQIKFGYGTEKYGCLFGAVLQKNILYVGELVQDLSYRVGFSATIDRESISRRVEYIGQGQKEGKSKSKRITKSNDVRFTLIRNSSCGESGNIDYACIHKNGNVFVGVAKRTENKEMIPRGQGFFYFAKEKCFYEGFFKHNWTVQNGRWKAVDGSTYAATYEDNNKKNVVVWNMKVPKCVHYDKCESFLKKSKDADAMFEELMRECSVEEKMTKSQKTRMNKMKRWQKKKEEEERMSGLMYSEQVSRECMICLEEKDTGKKCPYGHVVCHACFLTFSIQNGFDGTCSIFNKCRGVLEDA